MGNNYSIDDIARSYKWLGHEQYTELNGFHPEFKPKDKEWNKEKNSYPKIWYAKTLDSVIRFVERYSRTHTVCYSLNPRPKIFTNQNGYPRSATDQEIEESKNTLFDFDVLKEHATLKEFQAFLSRGDEYFKDFGLRAPVRAYTGKGCHLLFAFPAIKVNEHPEIRDGQKKFRDLFYDEFKLDLNNLGVRLDSTYDLRRVVKIYGTAKPNIGIVSRFFGDERIEDEALRDYLLSLSTKTNNSTAAKPGNELPLWFQTLLETNAEVRELWNGTGKPEGTDMSRSGFDYSLVRKLVFLGHENIDELATILYQRPDGSVRASGKGEQYIQRTVANAIRR